MTLRFIFHSMFLTVRALITFNAMHLNNPYKRLLRIQETTRTWFSASESSSRARKRSSPGIFGKCSADIYSLYSSRPFRMASTIFVFLLSPIASPFPAAVAEMPYIRYNKSWSPSTILPRVDQSLTLHLICYIFTISWRHIHFATAVFSFFFFRFDFF